MEEKTEKWPYLYLETGFCKLVSRTEKERKKYFFPQDIDERAVVKLIKHEEFENISQVSIIIRDQKAIFYDIRHGDKP